VKRLTLLVLLAVVGLTLAACGPSPRARADAFLKYVPAGVGEWERDPDETVRLLNSTVASEGHAILTFEGADDALAYLDIRTFGGPDAAEVAFTDRLRDLQLRGLVFEKDTGGGTTARVAQEGRARYALFNKDDFVVEVNTLAAAEDTPVSDEAFAALLDVVRTSFKQVVGK